MSQARFVVLMKSGDGSHAGAGDSTFFGGKLFIVQSFLSMALHHQGGAFG